MGILEDIKNWVKDFRLADIVAQIAQNIDKINISININIFGKQEITPLPPEVDAEKIANAKVTAEAQKQYQRILQRSLDLEGEALASMPPEESSKTVAELVVQSAVHALNVTVLDPVVKITEDVTVEIQDPEDESEDSP